MATQMNSFLAQSVAVGIIALVAMFPTPSKLREAITPQRTEIVSPEAAPDALIVDTPTYDDETITLEALFPMNCATGDHVSTTVLGDCATQLAGYIEAAQSLGNAGTPYEGQAPNPEVEQARRALFEICRVRWAMDDPPADPTTDGLCSSL